MLKEEIATLTLSGTAETKEAAFAHIFSQVKGEAAKVCPDMIIQIDPQDVEIVSASRCVYTERFLGIFWPRKRIRYDVKLHITVRLRSIGLDEICFVEQEERLSRLKQLIQMR